MEIVYPVHWPHYFTATIQGWKQLLSTERFKNIIIDSLRTMVQEKLVELNAFAIMNTHIHLIWQALPGHSPQIIQAFSQQRLRSMHNAIGETLLRNETLPVNALNA